jgi:hypothetical protein
MNLPAVCDGAFTRKPPVGQIGKSGVQLGFEKYSAFAVTKINSTSRPPGTIEGVV